MILVSDAGPVIALAKVDHLWLLPRLFDETLIAPAVRDEIVAKPGPEIPVIEAALQAFLRSVDPLLTARIVRATAHLGAGESFSIALAAERSGALLMDDHQGRVVARRLGLRVTGTAGIILVAKQQTLIPEVIPVLRQIRDRGYWLSDALLAVMAVLAGE